MNGNNILVSLDGTLIAGMKSSDIQTDAGTIEVASATQQQWREYIAGRKGWSLTVNCLLLAAADLGKLLNVGTTYTIVVRDRASAKTITGSAIMTVCKQTATRGNIAVGSFQFVGTGPLT